MEKEEGINMQTPLWQFMQNWNASYDDVLELLDEIESGAIVECSPEGMERINQFLTAAAQQGILPQEEGKNRTDLKNDVRTLLKALDQDGK